ncbi:MAG: RluA family pseudouridine synthase [Balneolales bacterium]|nr:RluA family pseudouridine synthase [Balneolales bacterium]
MDPDKTYINFVVPPGHTTGQRLDVYITSFVQNATRNKVQEAIKAGHVLVNGKREKASYKMQPGDSIAITLPKPPPPEAIPEEIPLNIVHEDDDIIILNKPPDMVVHPGVGNYTGTLVNGLLHYADTLSEVNDPMVRPGIVHRIDKNTSGLLVIAKHNQAHAYLAEQFARHDLERSYWAVVWGQPPAEGTFTGNIGRSKGDRKVMAVVPEPDGKHAVTHYKVTEYFDYLALVEIKLETGRTHQIRVHFAHHGFPVFGDLTYGGSSVRYGPNTGARKAMYENLFESLNRQCLHAKTLGFKHPRTREFVSFDSELPGDFRNVLSKLRVMAKV